jgi:NRAMP (natural resistance-associated macrophage protein)-like metal ion transporter
LVDGEFEANGSTWAGLMARDLHRRRDTRSTILEIAPAGGTGSMDAARPSALGNLKRFIRVLGPGVITGASDDDPSGIGTYAIAGASFGFNTLWMALVTLPMMASVQYMCAKIGMVSGRGLAGVLKIYYPRKVVYVTVFALVVANSINAGADIGAIAAGINLLVPIPVWSLIIPIALAVIALHDLGFIPAHRQYIQVAHSGAAGLRLFSFFLETWL